MIKQRTIWVLRVLMGWLFFWGFIDKLFGLGFATCRDKATGTVEYLCNYSTDFGYSMGAWIKGGSPTAGFLTNGTKGPFAEYFQSLVGNPMVDWLFMIGLAAIGLTLLFGVLVKLGSLAGVAMMLLMYAAGSILPANNPFLDQHLMYAVVLFGLAEAHPGLFRWKSI